jgi:hypothetical protein
MSTRVICWLCFTVLFALLPFFEPFFTAGVDNSQPSLQHVLGKGDLLLVCTALGAAAIGELLASKDIVVRQKLIVAFCSFALVLLAANTYDKVAFLGDLKRDYSELAVARRSVLLFVLVTIASTRCIILAERKHG